MSTSRSFKNCQSCGMPLRRDDQGGGTNEDGSKSDRFCSHCFQGGRFSMPDLTAEQMQNLVRGKLVELSALCSRLN